MFPVEKYSIFCNSQMTFIAESKELGWYLNWLEDSVMVQCWDISCVPYKYLFKFLNV